MKRKLFITVSVLILFSKVYAQQNLFGINSWTYQLQNINILQISNSNQFQLIVMDYSADGSDETAFSNEQISQIKNSGKKAISYISIGEAENYRFYWNDNWDSDNNGVPDQGAPSWLGDLNPDWSGNYKVRYWQHDWQDIIFSYIDKIIDQGFDGIYCDIIDAYYYWSEEKQEEPFADSLMIQFIINIKNHIKNKTQNEFYIIPQNGEFIINEANVSENLKESFFNSIDAVGVEDVFFPGDEPENNNFDPDQERISVLHEFRNHNKYVFSVEYLTFSDLISNYLVAASENDFIPYYTVRSLDILNDNLTGVLQLNNIPTNITLNQNYPNPFNPSTVIEFEIFRQAETKIELFDILGVKIKMLLNKVLTPGRYSVEVSLDNLPSGTYFYKLTSGENFITKKMVLLK